MAQVPVYQETTQLRPANRQDIEVRATAEDFGAAVGRGLQGVGDGLKQASLAATALQEKEDETRAKEAHNALMRADDDLKFNPETGFMFKQGRAALDSLKEYNDKIAENRRKFGEGLSPAARELYDRAAEATGIASTRAGITHAGQQRLQWINETDKSRSEIFKDQALSGFSDPAVVQKNLAAGVATIQQTATANGWSADKLKLETQKYVSDGHAKVALRIAESDPLAAKAYVDKHRGAMTAADQYTLDSGLKDAVLNEQSKREADRILKSTRTVPDTGKEAGASQTGPAPQAIPLRAGATVGEQGPTKVRAFLLSRAAGKPASHVDGLDGGFAANIFAMIQDAPAGISEHLTINSGHRSNEEQRVLRARYERGEGPPAAKEGESTHNHGTGLDIGWKGGGLSGAPPEAVAWLHANAGKYNLRFPYLTGPKPEPWHVEANDGNGGNVVARNNRIASRTVGPSWSAMQAELDKIADPKVRELTMKRINAQMEIQSKAEEQQRRAASAELWAAIDAGKTPDQVSAQIRDLAGMAAISSAWSYVESRSKREEIKSDERLLYQMRRDAATDPDRFAQIDLNDYRGRLSKEAIKELTEKQTSALTEKRKAKNEGINYQSYYNMADQTLKAIGITTAEQKTPAQEKKVAEQVARFQNALADSIEEFKSQNKRVPDTEEARRLINKLAMPIVIGEKNWLGREAWRDGYLFETRVMPDNVKFKPNIKYADIPNHNKKEIADLLEKQNGRKPKPEDVERVYNLYVMSANVRRADDK